RRAAGYRGRDQSDARPRPRSAPPAAALLGPPPGGAHQGWHQGDGGRVDCSPSRNRTLRTSAGRGRTGLVDSSLLSEDPRGWRYRSRPRTARCALIETGSERGFDSAESRNLPVASIRTRLLLLFDQGGSQASAGPDVEFKRKRYCCSRDALLVRQS